MQDTVGAVAYYHADGMAAGVSRSFCTITVEWALGDLLESDSGGILLKHPGRIGEVSIISLCSFLDLTPH
jgi:isoaspartyl peptidase/L-asparaginase-like protein (Ntn-hydrolase superfamily)